MDVYNNVIIEDENGTKTEYQVLAVFEVAGSNYVALLPVNESDAITFYGCNENAENEELELFVIENEIEFATVSEAFVKLMEEYAEEMEI